MLKEALLKKGLSSRETEVVDLVTKGMSNREIGKSLGLTEKTIKMYLTLIYRKMEIHSRAKLIIWCVPYMGFVSKGDVHDPQGRSWLIKSSGAV